MSRPFRVAIVGCGRIAGGYDLPRSRSRGRWRTHIRAYRADPRFRVVAVCDKNRAKAARFARAWGIARAYADLDAMLDAERPDVVSVCVPTEAHREVLLALARRSVRLVFSEKPLTGNLNDAKRVLEIFNRKRIPVAVNYMRRWCPNHGAVKRLIDSGALGGLRAINGIYSQGLLNIGSHLIDLIAFWCGDIARVRALRSHRSPGRERDVAGELELADGTGGVLQIGGARDFGLQLCFERGMVEASHFGYRGKCWKFAAHRSARSVFDFLPPRRGIDSAMKHAVANIAGRLNSRCLLRSDGASALGTLKVCEALIKSLNEGGRWIRVTRARRGR